MAVGARPYIYIYIYIFFFFFNLLLYSIIYKRTVKVLVFGKMIIERIKRHESCVLRFVFALSEGCFVILFTFLNLSIALALIDKEVKR